MSGTCEFKTLLTNSSLVCPSVNGQIVRIRSNESLVDTSDHPNPEKVARLQRKNCMINKYAQRMWGALDAQLIGLRSHTQFANSQEFLTATFPSAGVLFPRVDSEESLEQYADLAHYVNKFALKAAIGFRNWGIEQLPKRHRQNLELLEGIRHSKKLDQLARFYIGENETSPQDKTAKRRHHEASTLMGLSYLALIIDLSVLPEDEKCLGDFREMIDGIFPIRSDPKLLYVLFSDDGKLQHVTENPPKENGKYRAVPLTTRQFAGEPESNPYFIFEDRDTKPKNLYPAMLKVIRDRQLPLRDLLGARFILYNENYLHWFLSQLSKKMPPEWEIEPEKTTSTSPESSLANAVKYKVSHNQHSTPIEIQIDTLHQTNGNLGSWLEKQYAPIINYHTYRIRQLIHSVFPVLFPKEIYSVDWDSEDVQRDLIDYANAQAVS